MYSLVAHNRSTRSRPGSLKSKSQFVQKLPPRENGDVVAGVGGVAGAERKLDEFDIKILQQKRLEAEVKRS